MTNQSTPRKKTKLIIIGIAVLAVLGLFLAKQTVENKIKAWATEDLKLYEPLLKLESAKVEASWLKSSVTYKDVVYTIPDAPGTKFVISEIVMEGIDSDTLMGKPGDISTLDKIGISDMRLYAEDFEQPLMEIGYYEVKDIAYPYRDIRAILMENKGADDIFGVFQAMLPILNASAMKSGAGSMSDFKINLRQAGVADLSLGLVTSSGFRELDPETDGFEGAMDNAAYKNLRISVSNPDGSEILATLDSLEIRGLKFNYKDLIEAFASFDERTDPVTMIMAVMPSLYNYKFDEIRADMFSVSAQGVLFTIDAINLGPRTLKEQGPNSAGNINVVMNGMNVFSLETIGLDKLVLSDTLVDFINRPDEYMQDPELFAEFSENPFAALQGTVMENFHLKNLNVNGLVKLDNWRSDVAIDESIMLTSRFNTLQISNLGLRQASMVMMNSSGSQDVIGVLAMNPDGLTLDGGLELDLDIDPQTLVYDLAFDMAALEQGALTFALSGMSDQPRYLYQTYGEPLFEDMTITLEDKGVLNNIYKYQAMQGLAADADGARDALVRELDAKITGVGQHEAALLRGLRDFMLQGGKLKINFAPDSPALLDASAIFNNLEAMNVNVTHSK